MSTLPDSLTMTDLRNLAKLDASLKKAQAKYKVLSDKVKEALPKPGTYTFEEVIVDIQIPDVLDVEKLEREKPAEQFPNLYKTTPDPKAVQKETGKKYYILHGGSTRLSVKTAS